MILNIKQTQFGAEPEFEIEDTATGETLAKCTSLNHISTEIVFAGQNAYTLSFEPVLQEREGEKNELMYSILEHNRPYRPLKKQKTITRSLQCLRHMIIQPQNCRTRRESMEYWWAIPLVM